MSAPLHTATLPPHKSDPERNTVAALVSICVVNYNGSRVIGDTLAALSRLSDRNTRATETIVIDDASTDDSPNIVRDRCPGARLLTQPSRLGPAAARNRGYDAAAGQRVLFVDNDVQLDPHCLDTLSHALDGSADAVAAMPCVLQAERPGTVQYDGASCHYLGVQSLEGAGVAATSRATATRAIDSIITACCLVDRRRLGAASPFEAAFRIYLEDHDFGLRARIAGQRLLAVPSATCRHGSGTEGLSLRASGRYAPARVRNLIRNRWEILLTCYAFRTLAVLSPALCIYEASQLAGVLGKGWLAPWTWAAASMVKSLPRILRRRRMVQSTRRTLDRDILRGGPIPFARELATGNAERVALRALDALADAYWSVARRLL